MEKATRYRAAGPSKSHASPRPWVGGARRARLPGRPAWAVAAVTAPGRLDYARWPPRLSTFTQPSFAFLHAAAAEDDPLSAAANSCAAIVISSNVSGMFAISRVFAFANTLPAVERYGNFLL